MRSDCLEHRYELTDEETTLIKHLGLYHILHLPEVTTNRVMITILVKRWHSETCYFHLPTSEASITLEDVWCILNIPIHGAQVTFDRDDNVVALCDLFECSKEDLTIWGQYEIPWDDLYYDDLTIILCFVVVVLLILDQRIHSFPIGWG